MLKHCRAFGASCARKSPPSAAIPTAQGGGEKMGCSECQYMGGHAHTQPCPSYAVGKGHEQSPPSSRGGLGAPFACAGLQSREGGIGPDSRSCSCSPPGCLSPCPVSALARIKHHCSQPRDCRGSAGQRPASRHREPRVFRLTPTQGTDANSQRQGGLAKRTTGSRLSLRELVGTARMGGNGWTSPLDVRSGTPAGTSQPSSEENLCNS